VRVLHRMRIHRLLLRLQKARVKAGGVLKQREGKRVYEPPY
jgi:hypothetical protein